MNRHSGAAVAGFVLLLPAFILVSTGLLDIDRPRTIVHPLLVMGGLFLAVALNALTVVRLHFEREGADFVGTISVRVRGTALNLVALVISVALLAVIAAYLAVENFQPRTFG